MPAEIDPTVYSHELGSKTSRRDWRRLESYSAFQDTCKFFYLAQYAHFDTSFDPGQDHVPPKMYDSCISLAVMAALGGGGCSEEGMVDFDTSRIYTIFDYIMLWTEKSKRWST